MQTRTVTVSRFQAWRMKLGLRLINLGVKVCGEANQNLLKNIVSQFKSN
ncbi:hypothetical protein BCS71_25790 [Vibrio lentus]|nr:hypothetical protein [Vibrio lentus]